MSDKNEPKTGIAFAIYNFIDTNYLILRSFLSLSLLLVIAYKIRQSSLDIDSALIQRQKYLRGIVSISKDGQWKWSHLTPLKVLLNQRDVSHKIPIQLFAMNVSEAAKVQQKLKHLDQCTCKILVMAKDTTSIQCILYKHWLKSKSENEKYLEKGWASFNPASFDSNNKLHRRYLRLYSNAFNKAQLPWYKYWITKLKFK